MVGEVEQSRVVVVARVVLVHVWVPVHVMRGVWPPISVAHLSGEAIEGMEQYIVGHQSAVMRSSRLPLPSASMCTQLKDTLSNSNGYTGTYFAGDKGWCREVDLFDPKLELNLLVNPLDHAL